MPQALKSCPQYNKSPDLVTLLMLNGHQIYVFGQIQTSQAGGQLCRDTSSYEVSEYSLQLVRENRPVANLINILRS